VPGIATIQGFWASSEASAICAGLAFFWAGMRFNMSSSAWGFFHRFAREPRQDEPSGPLR
jgi:hypothetical protein